MNNEPESTLVELIRYNNWANAQVIAACQQVAAEQLAIAAPGAYGTIFDTLVHMIWAEADYIGRLTGDQPYPPFKRTDVVTVADWAAFAETVAGRLLETVQRIPPTQMVHEEEDGNTVDYRAQGLFIQVINHGIEHRTNVTTILSSLGIPAPEVDGWGYMWAYPERFDLAESSAAS